MDRESPESYMEPTAQGLLEAEEFVKYESGKQYRRGSSTSAHAIQFSGQYCCMCLFPPPP